MNDINTKRQNLIKIIESCHKDSFYSSLPVPTLIAVSKQQPDNKIENALKAGHRIFGENKLQDGIKRWSNLLDIHKDIELHYIGHLQTNKVKKALNFFDVIHTLDRESLALEISKHMTATTKTKAFMIQINTGNESQKGGVILEEANTFISNCLNNYKLNIVGLMCLPPFNEDPKSHFMKLVKLADQFSLPSLSMGMSNDFKVAIECGATHIRIGTKIFGERN